MQIHFILEESGFLRLQKHRFQWNLHHNGKIHSVVLTPMYHPSLVTLRAMTIFVVTILHAFQSYSSFVVQTNTCMHVGCQIAVKK
jgi:hypothetical protein